MNTPIRVLVVDDSMVCRELLSEILNQGSDIHVVATAKNGKEAILLTKKLKPDLITMDVQMPGLDGFATIEEIMLKPFSDPDGTDTETARADFDDVDDYDGLVDIGAVDQFGFPLASLANYTVSVAVTPSSALTGVPMADALRIDVRVQLAPYIDYTLTGYRTRL